MRIVNREQFLLLPEDTLYCKYEPCIFGVLEIKGETVAGIDFRSQQIADAVDDSERERFEVLDDALNAGTSFGVDLDCEYRDAFFDKEQLFVVWEKPDIEKLVERLQRCIKP